MRDDLIARATTVIQAPADEVWDALTDPKAIKQYMSVYASSSTA